MSYIAPNASILFQNALQFLASAWSSSPDPAGERIVLPKFLGSNLGIWEGENEMRYCGIGCKEGNCEAYQMSEKSASILFQNAL